MKILVTGAKGFVGRNLCAQLDNIRTGRAIGYRGVRVSEVYEYDRDSSMEDLKRYCNECDFVFHLAGVNRPREGEDFMTGNFGVASVLLETLKACSNRCPVMISSSVQAGLGGRFGVNGYGLSKKAGEELLFGYAQETGAKVLVYRFPNIFGKWCRPDYNSAVATFCHNIANGIPIKINDRSVRMELLYIDDLVDEMIRALNGKENRCHSAPEFCSCPVTHEAGLGEIADMIYGFARQRETLFLPDMPRGSLIWKLYSTYLSYLPPEKMTVTLAMNTDRRGSFTEFVKTPGCGQVSINISRPGVTKGQHWHNSKWEIFVVVSGRALIRQRRMDSDIVLDFEVSSDRLEAVYMIPGYTHSIMNLSDTEDLVTLMYCNETFDSGHPDTYSLIV